MIEAKYRGVTLDVHHNNPRDGFSAQALKTDDKDEGGELTKLIVRK